MKQIFYITIFLFINLRSYSQHVTISGYVRDKSTGEVLIGASVYDSDAYKGTATNGYGFYSISLQKGNHTVLYSYLGYKTEKIEINLTQNIEKDIFLSNVFVDIDAVIVRADETTKPLKINEFNIEMISMKDINQLPVMIGEADVIKAIQLQSGVKTLGDGSSGMFVRGGSSDQNLILIDEAPIYNPSHLFGLISVFNPDAINQVDLYKSNMPAQYGGRVSAVIDCKMKEGNMYDYNYSVSINPFSTTFTVNGPIVKEKSSFFISGRKSLVDLLFNPGQSMTLVPGFYDLNMKVNTKIGTKNRLFISFYNGKDLLESIDGFYNKWGNTSSTIRWNRNISNKLFLGTSLIISDYQNYMEFNNVGRNYKWLTGINDINLKFDFSYYLQTGNVIKMGVGSIYHKFIPGETVDTLQSIPRIQAFEHSLYLLNDIELFNWLGLNYGIRLSVFQNYGKATWHSYNENYIPISTYTNEKGIYNTYFNLEPRISANFKINTNYSIKLAYARNSQYMQVLQNNSLSYSSLETWFPANPNVKPIITDILSVGWFQNIGSKYFLSLELYYKQFQNQIDYVDHAYLINNPYIEGEIRKGTAKAYGVEMNFKKEIGRLTGNISYTYSRALRKIEGINDGEEYNSPYDIPHDLKITTSYKMNTKWRFNVAWMYMSGRPVTLPNGFYEYQDKLVPIYSGRNESRFPDYHRLDISFNHTPKKQSDKVYWTMNFGIYNLYAKKNPLGYEFDSDYSTGEVKVYQYTLFTILPNFSIKAEF